MKKNSLYIFFVLLLFTSCTKQATTSMVLEKTQEKSKTSFSNTGEAIHSLNGNWKFQTFCGDGSNYRNIFPQPTDIIIDKGGRCLLKFPFEE